MTAAKPFSKIGKIAYYDGFTHSSSEVDAIFVRKRGPHLRD